MSDRDDGEIFLDDLPEIPVVTETTAPDVESENSGDCESDSDEECCHAESPCRIVGFVAEFVDPPEPEPEPGRIVGFVAEAEVSDVENPAKDPVTPVAKPVAEPVAFVAEPAVEPVAEPVVAAEPIAPVVEPVVVAEPVVEPPPPLVPPSPPIPFKAAFNYHDILVVPGPRGNYYAMVLNVFPNSVSAEAWVLKNKRKRMDKVLCKGLDYNKSVPHYYCEVTNHSRQSLLVCETDATMHRKPPMEEVARRLGILPKE